MRYSTPGLKQGAVLSILMVMILGISQIVVERRKKDVLYFQEGAEAITG